MNAKTRFASIAGLLLAAGSIYAQETPNSFVGVGLLLKAEDHSVRVISVVPNTSAAQAQVKPGSYVEKINGVSTDGMKLKQCVDLIRGPAGTTVTLELVDTGSATTNTVDLTREKIAVPGPATPVP